MNDTYMVTGGKNTQKIEGSIEVAPTVGAATEAKQDAIVAAIENITIDPPAGGATEAKQDDLYELIQTLQELNQRLAPIASAMNAGAPALRTIPIASVSTAITGTVTATVASTVVSSMTTIGAVPATVVAWSQQNLLATQANVNNATA